MQSATDATEYPPIKDYAVIGDCRTVALVSRQGSIDWLCLPHFSSPSVFAALLDRRRGGRFAIRPTTPFSTRRAYVDRTNVLETEFATAGGRVRLTDVLPIKTEGCEGLDPDHEILRVVEGLDGETEIEILFEPRPDYARAAVRLFRRGRLGWVCEHGGDIFMLRAEVAFDPAPDGRSLRACFRLHAGDKIRVSLLFALNDLLVLAPLGEAADARLQTTIDWWRAWCRQCTYDRQYHDAVLRSALVLKLLTFRLSGAVVAAATTSLPEAIGGKRNWDYRYCWLRDAETTLSAFFDLGFHREGQAFLGWLMHSTRLTRPKLKILYDVFGRIEHRLFELTDFEGYRHSQPVRVGNDAVDQLQLDVYGSVIRGATMFAERGSDLMDDELKLLRGLGDFIVENWRKPDHGLWEVPGEPRQFVYSKLMCWAALDCLLRLHEEGRIDVPTEVVRRERDAIRDVIEQRGYDAGQQSYVAVLDGKSLDAAMLKMAKLGFKPASDPRVRSTLDRILQSLGDDASLYRYAHGFDGLESREGAFGICGFWAVELLALQGRPDEACDRFERLLSLGNDVGLMAEEYDPATGEALGNFPQAYTHAGLIGAALALAGGPSQAARASC